MHKTVCRLSSALALLGACLLVLAFGAAPAAAQPASYQNVMPESHELTDGTVDARYAQAIGEVCTGGSGVTVCPKLKSVGDPNDLKGVIGVVRNQEMKLRFCVSPEGNAEDVEIVVSSGKPRVDREMLKYIGRTYRYTPGTVDGAAARLCNVVASFQF